MQIAFHQPNYLPNLSFFHKMAQVDLFVITTNLQFVRREWHNRAKLKVADKDMLLTVPVRGSNRQMIRDALIGNDGKWRNKHMRTIENTYRRGAPAAFMNELFSIYQQPFERLSDLNVTLIHFLKDTLGIRTPVVVDEETNGKRHELLINICEKYHADSYLSGVGGKQYMSDEYIEAIQKHNISHDFVHRNITAEHPYSSIHYILSNGIDTAKEIIHGDG